MNKCGSRSFSSGPPFAFFLSFICMLLVISRFSYVTSSRNLKGVIPTRFQLPPIRPMLVSSDSGKKCRVQCARTRQRPLCGSDGRTYYSRCQIRHANCQGHSVSIKHRGECPESTRCRSERVYAQGLARKPMVGIFIPECNSDGSYKRVQCHASTGYCWCVNNHGKPIPGSSSARKTIDCDQVGSSSGRARLSRDKRRKRDCSSKDRTTFTRNLIRIFKSEYLRMPTKLTNDRRRAGSAIDTIEKRVLEWKFSELDRNGDSKLSRKELRHLRRMVKKIVKPKPCARTFTKHCDLDQNRKITRKEWSVCLWMDAKILFGIFQSLNSGELNFTSVEEHKKKTAPQVDNLNDPSSLLNRQRDLFQNNQSHSLMTTSSPNKAETNPSSRSVSQHRNCLEARRSAMLDARNNSDTEVHIPECTKDGKYVKVQCDKITGYCWCVDENSGQPVLGTSKLKERPDCENDPLKTRTIKGCPERRKRKFLNDLVDFLSKEKANATDYSIVVSDSSLRQSELEQLVRWKFTQIDTNVNRLLDRKEWKPFRRMMKAHKNLRKCGRKFLRFCDGNKDRKITIQEWLDCFNISAGYGTLSSSRKGPNPFDTYLKD